MKDFCPLDLLSPATLPGLPQRKLLFAGECLNLCCAYCCLSILPELLPLLYQIVVCPCYACIVALDLNPAVPDCGLVLTVPGLLSYDPGLNPCCTRMMGPGAGIVAL